MKRISFLTLLAALLLFALPSSSFAQKKSKKNAKVAITELSNLSFVVKTSDSSVSLIFTGEGGVYTTPSGQYTLKVTKWNPKKQEIRFSASSFGSSVETTKFSVYLTCYEGGKCRVDGTTLALGGYTSSNVNNFGQASARSTQSALSLDGTYELIEAPLNLEQE